MIDRREEGERDLSLSAADPAAKSTEITRFLLGTCDGVFGGRICKLLIIDEYPFLDRSYTRQLVILLN